MSDATTERRIIDALEEVASTVPPEPPMSWDSARSRRPEWEILPSEEAPIDEGAKLANHRLRRRGIAIGAALVGLAAVALLLALLPTQTDSPRPARHPAVARDLHVAGKFGTAELMTVLTSGPVPTKSNVSATAVADAEQRFTVTLLRQLAPSGTSSTNLVISPSSAALVLAMLELGAKGQTEQQIARVLGTSSLGSRTQASDWQALDAELTATAAKNGIAVDSANSLWQQKGTQLGQNFMSDLQRFFASGVWQVDFRHNPSTATKDINEWVTQETQGHIPVLFGPTTLDSTTALVLANAVYFKAHWQQPFPQKATTETFTVPSGATVHVPFMQTASSTPLKVLASTTPSAATVQLPYQGGQLSALAIMPKSSSLSHFVQQLTPITLADVISGLHMNTVDLAMPTLTLTDGNDLGSALEQLGMSDAFSTQADFSAISPQALKVQSVQQKATLQVTPSGTQASAATGVALEPFSLEVSDLTIRLDHPFLFLVRDDVSGAILFSAEVNKP